MPLEKCRWCVVDGSEIGSTDILKNVELNNTINANDNSVMRLAA